MQRKKYTKWDTLYDSEHRSLFSKIEELAINNYFSKIFTKAILSSTNLKSGKVFEPGSGGGMASAKLASLGFELTCMDLSQNALRKSTSLFKSLSLDGKYILGDIFHIPVKNEQFDIVFNQGVMEHFRLEEMDPSHGVHEMLRTVKKGGTLIILVPAYFSPLFLIYRFLKFFHLIKKFWPYEDQDFLHRNELFEMMEKAQCKNIVVRRLWSSFFFSMIGYCKKQ